MPNQTETLTHDSLGYRVRQRLGPVDADWIRAYAAICGLEHQRWFDEAALAVHPLFPVCYEWPAWLQLARETLPERWHARGVHAAQDTRIHRPVQVGDVLEVTVELIGIAPGRAGARLTLCFTTVDADNRPVSMGLSEWVLMGLDVTQAGGRPMARLPDCDQPRPWRGQLELERGLAAAYTACSGIANPIHTDYAAARQGGFQAPIVHGTATLGRVVACLIEQAGRRPPGRIRARFLQPVVPPARLLIEAVERCFTASLANGEPVITGMLD